jgi:hypothetical protein
MGESETPGAGSHKAGGWEYSRGSAVEGHEALLRGKRRQYVILRRFLLLPRLIIADSWSGRSLSSPLHVQPWR